MKPKRVRVASAQMKFRAGLEENVAWIISMIRSAGEKGVDMLLFPECAVTGYNCDFSRLKSSALEGALEKIRAAAKTADCNVLVGTPTSTGRKWFNSLVVINRSGREIFRYHKNHLTPRDQEFFTPGNGLAFFKLDGVQCTALICHERRYPEIVRLPVMLGAQIIFHPNAGLDTLAVSKRKRAGRDGIAVRAFENQVYYVFANLVGPQGDGLWSAGDSKIVSPQSEVLALANNRDEIVIQATLELEVAGRKYAREALQRPAFLQKHWELMLQAVRRQLAS